MSTLPCKYCNKKFNPRNKRNIYCSIDCRYFSRMEIDREKYVANHAYFEEARTCIVCGKQFVAKGSEMTRNKSCSEECMAERRRSINRSCKQKEVILHRCGHTRKYEIKKYLIAIFAENGKEKIKEYLAAKNCKSCKSVAC
jgi:hypothetical protein